jgi:hypothetical protein
VLNRQPLVPFGKVRFFLIFDSHYIELSLLISNLTISTLLGSFELIFNSSLIRMNLFFLNTGKRTQFVETHFWAFGIDDEHPIEIINVMSEELIIWSGA